MDFSPHMTRNHFFPSKKLLFNWFRATFEKKYVSNNEKFKTAEEICINSETFWREFRLNPEWLCPFKLECEEGKIDNKRIIFDLCVLCHSHAVNRNKNGHLYRNRLVVDWRTPNLIRMTLKSKDNAKKQQKHMFRTRKHSDQLFGVQTPFLDMTWPPINEILMITSLLPSTHKYTASRFSCTICALNK